MKYEDFVLFLCVPGGFCGKLPTMRDKFTEAVHRHQVAFGFALDNTSIGRLGDYYEFVEEHNPLLHLVGPCTPEEFAIRHILESLCLLEHLPKNAAFVDVGSGAGLPSIPCLLARPDLNAVLIESKEKKAAYLSRAVEELELAGRTEIVNKQFIETDPSSCKYVTCRALDKFTERLPRLIEWAKGRTMLLFGGEGLAAGLEGAKLRVSKRLMPLSEKRFLFVCRKPAR